MTHRANSVVARMYDLLTTQDRWMSVQNIADWLDVDRPIVQKSANRVPVGELWHVRDNPEHDGRSAVEKQYRAIPDQWHRIAAQKQPPSGRKPRMNVPTPNDEEPWHEYAARVLGLDGDIACTQCDGTGTVTAQPKKGDVATAIKGTKGYGQKMLAAWCENPRLEDLQRVADQAGTDLDGAARFLTRVHDLIEAQLA